MCIKLLSDKFIDGIDECFGTRRYYVGIGRNAVVVHPFMLDGDVKLTYVVTSMIYGL